ncbi:MAG: LSm family protein [Sulfolobales archaeon]|nr:LSm family protein [Sulfolobales archaeon]MCX8208769.1 LSm family protein [Sulfolobales archaeon]
MSDAAQRLLNENLGQDVLVKLRSSEVVRGRLRSFDQHLNIVLEDAYEVAENRSRKLGTVVIRGENIVMISPASRG